MARRPNPSARDERRARELAKRRQQRHQPRRDAKRRWIAGALLLAVGGIVLVAATRDLGSKETPEPESVLLTGAPPWPPVYEELNARVEELGFPPSGDESYHAHSLLSIFADGKPVEVPQNIGIDPTAGGHSSLHTHTSDGVIHMEADDPYPYKITDLFSVWGVAFDGKRLGGLRPAAGEVLEVYVNGERAADPLAVEMNDGDNIVVGVGAPGSFPTEPPDDALSAA